MHQLFTVLAISGLSASVFLLWTLAVFSIAVLLFGPVFMIIRCSHNDALSKTQKTWWILAQLLLFPSAILYMIFIEKSRRWRIVGIITLLTLVGLAGCCFTIKPSHAAASSETASSLEDQLNILDDQFKARSKQPGAPLANRMCASLVSLEITLMKVKLQTQPVTEPIVASLMATLNNQIKDNSLYQEKNCDNWVDLVNDSLKRK